MEEQKKTKKPRFTEKEIDAIVDNVKENSVMLLSKFSDVVSNTRKKEAWKKVQNAVNAVSFTSRTSEEIKKKWDDIKRGTKKKATSITNERKKTGGGVPSFIALSKMEEDVVHFVTVVGEERVFGISTGCDTMKTPIKASCAETVVSAVMPPFENTTGNITQVLHVDHTRQTPKRPTESENYLPVKQKKTDSER
ncbi:myb-related transcription factor, partner of profilin-like [Mytilus galloprovincialis]|uniref:myb-related transcription factor, partner of profilin-like n=1 Tax=Mytilus galloprovincialis TaxID=29158 RepID=UPI003F7BA17D